MNKEKEAILVESIVKLRQELDQWWTSRERLFLFDEDLYGCIVHFLVRAHKIGFEDGSRIVK